MPEPKLIRSCSIWRTLEIIGDTPILLLMESYWLGSRRFDQFQKQTGLQKPVVSNRLQKLIAAGCLEKVAYMEKPKRYEYRGTEKFYDFYHAALSMLNWERVWADKTGKTQIILTHKNCGQATEPFPACGGCGQPLDARDVDWAPGPGLGTMPASYSRRRKTNNKGSFNSRNTSLFSDSMQVIGDRWSSLIIRSIFTNFNKFHEILEDSQIATNILSDRLNELCLAGFITKVETDEKHYKLTPKGRDLYPILIMLMGWGDKWLPSEGGPPLLLTHKPCAESLNPKILCSACNEPIELNDMTFTILPNPANSEAS